MTDTHMGESQDYRDGLADGLADKDPDPGRLAYGWNRMNDYERGYVAAGPPGDNTRGAA
jgi:hypothetical protein